MRNEKVQLKPSNFELGNCLIDKFNQVQSEKQYNRGRKCLMKKCYLNSQTLNLENCLSDKFNQVQSGKQYRDSGTKGKRNKR